MLETITFAGIYRGNESLRWVSQRWCEMDFATMHRVQVPTLWRGRWKKQLLGVLLLVGATPHNGGSLKTTKGVPSKSNPCVWGRQVDCPTSAKLSPSEHIPKHHSPKITPHPAPQLGYTKKERDIWVCLCRQHSFFGGVLVRKTPKENRLAILGGPAFHKDEPSHPSAGRRRLARKTPSSSPQKRSSQRCRHRSTHRLARWEFRRILWKKP